MLRHLMLSVLVLIVFGGPAVADNWNFDQAHSSIGFSVSHMVISNIKGYFRDYTGQIVFDGKDIEKGTVEITIQIASINTDNEQRDTHLRSADFFDAGTYPTMTFKSKKITKGQGNTFTMVGDLTMKGVTREVTLTGQLHGIIQDPYGNTRAGISATTVINRQDFKVSWTNKLVDGSLIVGNDVTINIDIEIIKAK
jgi:polyisoprenoid-binding protein YceI